MKKGLLFIAFLSLILSGCGSLLFPDPPKVEVNMNNGDGNQTDETAEPYVYTISEDGPTQ